MKAQKIMSLVVSVLVSQAIAMTAQAYKECPQSLDYSQAMVRSGEFGDVQREAGLRLFAGARSVSVCQLQPHTLVLITSWDVVGSVRGEVVRTLELFIR